MWCVSTAHRLTVRWETQRNHMFTFQSYRDDEMLIKCVHQHSATKERGEKTNLACLFPGWLASAWEVSGWDTVGISNDNDDNLMKHTYLIEWEDCSVIFFMGWFLRIPGRSSALCSNRSQPPRKGGWGWALGGRGLFLLWLSPKQQGRCIAALSLRLAAIIAAAFKLEEINMVVSCSTSLIK